VGASNPKAILFFTALFPQFIDPKASLWSQYLIFSVTFIICELYWLMFYAYFAKKALPWLQAKGRARLLNRITGGLFVSAGTWLATLAKT